MTLLDEILKDNKEFVKTFKGSEMPHNPQKVLVVFSCMDCRLIEFFKPALGIKRGDAKIITNAGNTIVNDDPIRSMVVAVYALGAREILVVGHTQCGMANVDVDKIKSQMLKAGISQDELDNYDLDKWIGGFESEEENVLKTCEIIRNHPLMPDIPVHGLIIDIITGELKVIVDGY